MTRHLLTLNFMQLLSVGQDSPAIYGVFYPFLLFKVAFKSWSESRIAEINRTEKNINMFASQDSVVTFISRVVLNGDCN